MNLADLEKGLIVSCQAFPDEPLYGDNTMVKIAIAASLGGAVAIRANGPENISNLKKLLALPVFGINKILPEKYSRMDDVIITPTLEAARQIVNAGSDIVAVDCTLRENRKEEDIIKLIKDIRSISKVYIMGEVSTLEEGLIVEKAGCDIVSTTISGYTHYSRHIEEPDFELIKELVENTSLLVNAEGRFHSPSQVLKAFELGAWTVTVGSAITRPKFITEQFVKELEALKKG